VIGRGTRLRARRASTMKFTEKYEILEMVTSGRVSTFHARERATQESVIVYTFECARTGSGELNAASIIARFLSLAPNPPGVIIKVGLDEPSSSAFLTTRMPDLAALKAWVQAYQSPTHPTPGQLAAAQPTAKYGSARASDVTAELNSVEVKSAQAQNEPTGKLPSKEELGEGTTAEFSIGPPPPRSSQPQGEFTRLFNEANAFQPLKRGDTPTAARPSNATDAMAGERLGDFTLGSERLAPAPPRTATPVESPGSFTKEFLGLSNENVELTPKQSPAPAPPKKEPGAFTKEFLAVSQPSPRSMDGSSESAPPTKGPSPNTAFGSAFGTGSGTESRTESGTESSKPGSATRGFGGGAENQKAGPGEFTSFFRDPFDHPQAAGKSMEIPDLGSAPRKPPTCEFTKVFGRENIERGEASPLPPPETEKRPISGSFTQLFGNSSPGKGSQLGASTLDTDPNTRPSFMDQAPVAPAAPAAPVSPTPPTPFRGGISSTPLPPPVDPLFSQTPTPAPPAPNQLFMNRAASEATDVFRAPGGEAPPVAATPSGPSEFTVFISRGQLNGMLPPEPAAPQANAAGSAQPPIFAPPPVPQPPPIQLAPPQPPAAPAIKYPPMPAAPMPAAPALAPPPMPAPPAAGVAPKSASFWPLITVLTILLAIGALLVMYFVMKH